MKLTRVMFLGLAFLIPAVSTAAKAEDKPATEAPAEGKKAKKGSKKAEKKEEGEKKEGAAK